MSNGTLPKLTIALFSYNQEDYIEEAVKGILAQDYPYLDIIFSDDCSTDRTFEIIQNCVSRYKGIHKNIILNRNNINLGLGAHIDKIVEMVKTEWLITAAGDDISLPYRCSHMADLIQTYPKATAFGGVYDIVNERGDIVKSHTDTNLIVTDFLNYKSLKDLAKKPEIYGCAAMWHISLFKDYLPLNGVSAEDLVLSYRCVISGSQQVISNKCIVKYREHQQSSTNFSKEDTSLWHHRYSLIFSKCWLKLIDDLLNKRKSFMLQNNMHEWHHYYTLFYAELNRCVLMPFTNENGSLKIKIKWLMSICISRRSTLYLRRRILSALKKLFLG